MNTNHYWCDEDEFIDEVDKQIFEEYSAFSKTTSEHCTSFRTETCSTFGMVN